jgi:hypothetical protein
MLRKNLSDLVDSSEERTPSCSRPTLFIDKGLVSGFLNESFGRVHVTTFRSFKKKDNQGNPTAFCTEVNDFQVDNEGQVEGHIAKVKCSHSVKTKFLRVNKQFLLLITRTTSL